MKKALFGFIAVLGSAGLCFAAGVVRPGNYAGSGTVQTNGSQFSFHIKSEVTPTVIVDHYIYAPQNIKTYQTVLNPEAGGQLAVVFTDEGRGKTQTGSGSCNANDCTYSVSNPSLRETITLLSNGEIQRQGSRVINGQTYTWSDVEAPSK